jgi:heme exporter protein B
LGKDIFKLLKKEYKIEFRNSSALVTSLIFTFALILSISLILQGATLSKKFQAILIWIILLFSAFNSITHIFLREEEQNTSLFLSLHYAADKVFLSKYLFNLSFMLFVSVTTIPLFIVFLQINPKDIALFILTIICGTSTISSALSLLGAIAAKAGQGPSLLSILSFPIILPVMWINIRTTLASLTVHSQQLDAFLFWASIISLTLALSLILFKYIWSDTNVD